MLKGTIDVNYNSKEINSYFLDEDSFFLWSNDTVEFLQKFVFKHELYNTKISIRDIYHSYIDLNIVCDTDYKIDELQLSNLIDMAVEYFNTIFSEQSYLQVPDTIGLYQNENFMINVPRGAVDVSWRNKTIKLDLYSIELEQIRELLEDEE